jgi:hypothetical protein
VEGASDEEEIMRQHESFLGRLEETLSRMSEWLAARRRDEQGRGRHARVEALRREIAEARRGIRETARADVARVRASLDDLTRDYDAPLPHTSLSHVELEAFRRHLHTTARLVRDFSNIDSPAWDEANEEYERSWADVERAFDSQQGESPSP